MPWLRCVKVQKKLEMKILRTIRKKMESPSRIRGLILHRETERRIKDLGYTIFWLIWFAPGDPVKDPRFVLPVKMIIFDPSILEP